MGKEAIFIASSRADLADMPKPVKAQIGHTLWNVQSDVRDPHVKQLKGFGGQGVFEVIENHDGGTYRAVYTLRFAGYVYVLHCFQKKSKKGVKTPLPDIAKIKARMKVAEEDFQKRLREKEKEKEKTNGIKTGA